MFVIASHFALWLLWIMAAGVIERYKKRPFTGLKLRLAQVFLGFFWVVDVYVNLAASTVLFLQLPPVGPLDELWERKYRLTLTHRLKYNITQGGWRGNLALWMCRYLVDPWQPGHCGL